MESRDKYALYAQTVCGGALRGLFETLCHIIHDANLVWEPPGDGGDGGGDGDGDSGDGGLKLLTMDGARCALIFLRLQAASFDEYHCPGVLTTGINMTSLWKLLKMASSQDCITLFIEKSHPHELGVTIQNAEKNALTEYRLKLLDCNSETINVPDVTFDRVLTLPSIYFQRLCREMTHLGDYMTISTQGTSLTLACEGSFASQSTCIGESEGCMAVTESTGEDVDGTFSLRYLSLFTRASGLCGTVQLLLKKEYPLILSYQVASLGTLRFCLAARIDD